MQRPGSRHSALGIQHSARANDKTNPQATAPPATAGGSVTSLGMATATATRTLRVLAVVFITATSYWLPAAIQNESNSSVKSQRQELQPAAGYQRSAFSSQLEPRTKAFRVSGFAFQVESQRQLQSPSSATAPQQQPEFIKQGQQLVREGKLDDALALYRKTLQTTPDSVPANIAAGSVLDLMGKGEDARKYFSKAIAVADTPERKAGAERAMAISYAFEGNCGKTIEYEKQVFDYYGSVKNFYQQGEIADEAARVCIDSGDLESAQKWYKIGHDTGLQEPDIKPARQDLWNFRWEHAQARLAARRGDKAEAQKHVAAAQAILDKGTMPEQAQFLPYLKGYVAFYVGDYKTALEELGKANQNDPFVQIMIGETYEKLGDKDNAMVFYRKASTASGHNPPAAYAVPLARKKFLSS